MRAKIGTEILALLSCSICAIFEALSALVDAGEDCFLGVVHSFFLSQAHSMLSKMLTVFPLCSVCKSDDTILAVTRIPRTPAALPNLIWNALPSRDLHRAGGVASAAATRTSPG